MACSTANVLEALVDKWGLIIMRDLILGLTRYEDLRRSTDATNATLSDRLRRLETNGLIERRKYQSRPDRFEYVPTSKGSDVGLVIQALMQVGDRWGRGNGAGPPMITVDRQTGRAVRLAMVDAETGDRIPSRDVAILAGPGADDAARRRLELAASSRRR